MGKTPEPNGMEASSAGNSQTKTGLGTSAAAPCSPR